MKPMLKSALIALLLLPATAAVEAILDEWLDSL